MYPANETKEKPLKFRLGMIILFAVATLFYIPVLCYTFDCSPWQNIIIVLLTFSLTGMLTVYSSFLYKKIKPKVVFIISCGSLTFLYIASYLFRMNMYGFPLPTMFILRTMILISLFVPAIIFMIKESKLSKLFVIIAFCVSSLIAIPVFIRCIGNIITLLRGYWWGFDIVADHVHSLSLLAGLFLLGLASCNGKSMVAAKVNYGVADYGMNYGGNNYSGQNYCGQNSIAAPVYEDPNHVAQNSANYQEPVYTQPVYTPPVYTAPVNEVPSPVPAPAPVPTPAPAVSSADEIVKFKQLLDQGIITQEEFDAKKKQLLGL